MAQLNNSVNVNDCTHGITLTVSGMREFAIRLWIAKMFFRIGAKVAGVGIEFEMTRSVVETTKPGDEWRSFERAPD